MKKPKIIVKRHVKHSNDSQTKCDIKEMCARDTDALHPENRKLMCVLHEIHMQDITHDDDAENQI